MANVGENYKTKVYYEAFDYDNKYSDEMESKIKETSSPKNAKHVGHYMTNDEIRFCSVIVDPMNPRYKGVKNMANTNVPTQALTFTCHDQRATDYSSGIIRVIQPSINHLRGLREGFPAVLGFIPVDDITVNYDNPLSSFGTWSNTKIRSVASGLIVRFVRSEYSTIGAYTEGYMFGGNQNYGWLSEVDYAYNRLDLDKPILSKDGIYVRLPYTTQNDLFKVCKPSSNADDSIEPTVWYTGLVNINAQYLRIDSACHVEIFDDYVQNTLPCTDGPRYTHRIYNLITMTQAKEFPLVHSLREKYPSFEEWFETKSAEINGLAYHELTEPAEKALWDIINF